MSRKWREIFFNKVMLWIDLLIAPVLLLFFFQKALFTLLLIGLAAFIIKLKIETKIWKTILSSGIQAIDAMDCTKFKKLIRAVFEDKGYDVRMIRKAKTSNVHLLLTRNGKKIVVHVKKLNRTGGALTVKEASASRFRHKAAECWIVTNRDFSEIARQLAESSNVKIINREELIVLLDDVRNTNEIRLKGHL